MSRLFFVICILLFISLPLSAKSENSYNYRDRIGELAFNTDLFFSERKEQRLFMSINYRGDDYDYPVYAIAVRKGCISTDVGTAKKECHKRLTARMVRSPYEGEPQRPRHRGQKLLRAISEQKVKNDKELIKALDEYGLEWYEADINSCETAVQFLKSSSEINFFPNPILLKDDSINIYLHADTMDFSFGDYNKKVHYSGVISDNTPGAWANQFARSLESCWFPSKAEAPWHIGKV